MSIEVTCSGCGATLRVADHHAGRNAKCPQCENVFRVPAKPTSDVPPPTPAQSSGWLVRAADGQVYGPAEDVDIERWIAENRINEACQVRRENETDWRPAAEVFPKLQASSKPEPAETIASDLYSASSPDATPHNPYASPTGAIQSSNQKPHRGATILILGIIGVLCCGLLAPVAWIMGHTDIKEMDSGVMDRSGHGLTQAGMIIGIVGTILLILQAVAIPFIAVLDM